MEMIFEITEHHVACIEECTKKTAQEWLQDQINSLTRSCEEQCRDRKLQDAGIIGVAAANLSDEEIATLCAMRSAKKVAIGQ